MLYINTSSLTYHPWCLSDLCRVETSRSLPVVSWSNTTSTDKFWVEFIEGNRPYSVPQWKILLLLLLLLDPITAQTLPSHYKFNSMGPVVTSLTETRDSRRKVPSGDSLEWALNALVRVVWAAPEHDISKVDLRPVPPYWNDKTPRILANPWRIVGLNMPCVGPGKV